MTTLADLNRLWPADHNATPWVATPDGSCMLGAGVDPDIPRPQKEGHQNVPAEKSSAFCGAWASDVAKAMGDSDRLCPGRPEPAPQYGNDAGVRRLPR
jgi:hypothetical protein